MMTTAVHLLVFDGLADWEPSFALTALRRWGNRAVRTVGFSADPITTMGGLRVIPDVALADLELASVEMFLIPGGDLWECEYPRRELERVLHDLVANRTPIAAICAATTALARAGLLAGRRHTSNGRGYLEQQAPGYDGRELYEERLAVRDRGIITASGLGAPELAAEIFVELGMFTDDERALWREMYRNGRMPAGV